MKKLRRPVWIEANGQAKHNVHKYKINISDSPNSISLNVGKQKYRALVDSGAELSLMRYLVYNNLSNKPRFFKKNICLQSVSGQALKIDGCVNLTFLVKGLTMTHTFIVVKDMNQILILGRDWLKQNWIRMYID